MAKSKLNDKWIREGSQIKVTTTFGIGRIIFGLPWFLFGVYFLYKYLILGTLEYIKAGQILALFTTDLPGSLFILVIFGGIFIMPGWVLTFLNAHTVIDADLGEVEEVRDYRVFKRRKHYLLEDYKYIMVVGSTTKVSSDSKTRTRYYYTNEIRMVVKDEKSEFVTLASMEDDKVADKLAKEISDLTKLPIRKWGQKD